MKKQFWTAGALTAVIIGVLVALGAFSKNPAPIISVESPSTPSTHVATDSTSHSETPIPISEKSVGGVGAPTPPREAADPRSVRITVEDATYVGLVPEGSTVLEAMNLSRSEGLEFTGRDYPSLGFFVESINGKKGENGYYWFLYVNGKSSHTGVSQTILKASDTVLWKYEKSY